MKPIFPRRPIDTIQTASATPNVSILAKILLGHIFSLPFLDVAQDTVSLFKFGETQFNLRIPKIAIDAFLVVRRRVVGVVFREQVVLVKSDTICDSMCNR